MFQVWTLLVAVVSTKERWLSERPLRWSVPFHQSPSAEVETSLRQTVPVPSLPRILELADTAPEELMTVVEILSLIAERPSVEVNLLAKSAVLPECVSWIAFEPLDWAATYFAQVSFWPTIQEPKRLL